MAGATSTRRIEGGCHCGNIRFTFELPDAGGAIPVRSCGCSFCAKHGGAYTSHPGAAIDVRITDPPEAMRYRFGTETADFHICRKCGVVPVVTSLIDGNLFAVISVNAFEGVDPADFDRSEVNFDGETVADRLARRRRNWIPNVTIA